MAAAGGDCGNPSVSTHQEKLSGHCGSPCLNSTQDTTDIPRSAGGEASLPELEQARDQFPAQVQEGTDDVDHPSEENPANRGRGDEDDARDERQMSCFEADQHWERVQGRNEHHHGEEDNLEDSCGADNENPSCSMPPHPSIFRQQEEGAQQERLHVPDMMDFGDDMVDDIHGTFEGSDTQRPAQDGHFNTDHPSGGVFGDHENGQDGNSPDRVGGARSFACNVETNTLSHNLAQKSAAAESVSESDGRDSRFDSRASEPGQEDGRDMGGHDDNEEEEDEAEGRTQKREREQRGHYFQRLVGESFYTISSSYVTANRAIRGVETEQRNMLETENEIGENLVKFGVRIREATHLMQAQINAAFTGQDVAVASTTLVQRKQRLGDEGHDMMSQAGTVDSGTTQTTVLRREKPRTDHLTGNGGQSGFGTFGCAHKVGSANAGAHRSPFSPSNAAHTVGADKSIGGQGSSSIDENTNGGEWMFEGPHHRPQTDMGRDETEILPTLGDEEHAEGRGLGRPTVVDVGARGDPRDDGNTGGGEKSVKRPRWNSSVRGTRAVVTPCADVSGAPLSSSFRRGQRGNSSSIGFQNQSETRGRWNRG